MFQGRFEDHSERPMVDCHLTVRQLNIDGVVPFLIDSGSDCTVLMPADAKRLKVDYRKLTQTRISFGFGGKSVDYVVPAALIVRDGDVAHAYRFALRIAKGKKALEDAPSVLGRDILNRWRLMMDYRNLTLEIEVRSSDEQFSLA